MARRTLLEIQTFTEAMIHVGLSNEQNFPSTHGEIGKVFEITVSKGPAHIIALKNVSYRKIYETLVNERCFNVKLLDGALIFLRYRFLEGEIAEHCLSYFPSPDLEHFQNDPELYLSDEIYADVISRSIVPFPFRFDFNCDEERFVEIHHPYSHFTLGQYKNCRIPVSSPLCPLTFGSFLLRNFYNTAFRKYSEEFPTTKLVFNRTITSKEQEIPHVVLTSS